MGIESREYMAGEGGSRGTGPASWTAVTTLIVINVIVFLVQTVFPNVIEPWFMLTPQVVTQGQIWRLTTYDFLHSTDGNLPLHLLFNMWLLWLAGTRVEAAIGKREFFVFYLVAGILSGVIFLAWSALMQTDAVAIGASGAAVAVMIVYAMYWPHTRWYIYGILPVPVIVLAVIAAAFDILPMLQELGGRGAGGNIAHSAHVGGMLFGFLYARNGWRLAGFLPGGSGKKWSNPLKSRPKLRVLNPETLEPDREETIPVSVEARLDQLLEKISEKGEASLTAEERKFLTDTSRRYRSRREF